ncbi:hypothetical protein [Antarcticimicrobium luteum]|uniref:Uncharacterized protein n=1 Tax=Antarcticimicrobium luteum TaxID=2547397 RepID=A0A4R5VE20_9RHOB|nr:hypothetical protein [Antarcticimicrobium luteum]TDK50422.1 hypothetical protein E1832_06305 [Antarcticimicrobium luteum]
MPHDSDFQITDEMIEFNTEARGATAALLENLKSTSAGARLSATIAKVTGLVAQRYGVVIDSDSALMLPGVKAAVMGSDLLDEDSLLFAAEQKIAAVAFKALGGSNGGGASDTRVPDNFDTMSPQARINWARQNGVA